MNITVKNKTTFNNIELIMINVAGTLIDYSELWLKQIGYISQRIAEKHSKYQGELFRIRAMVMKALGVDPETGEIDLTGPFFCLSETELQQLIATILHINNVKWLHAMDSALDVILNMPDDINYNEYTKLFPDTLDFLENYKGKIQLASYSLNYIENAEELIRFYKLNNHIEKHYCFQQLNKNKSLETIKNINIDPKKIILIADCVNDFKLEDSINNKVVINRNLIDKEYYDKFSLNYWVDNLSEIGVS